ncbi:hypothetical protein KKC32_04790 [Patescibacteria group bacterium]|nr:hypothetical protein [Patescibacteria group bacterium]
MFETTQDIFYIVASFCILWLTAFLCAGLFYLIRFLKQCSELMMDIKEKFERATSLVGFFRKRIMKETVKGALSLAADLSEIIKTKIKKRK